MQTLRTGGTIKALKPNHFLLSHGKIARSRFLVKGAWRKGTRESRAGRGREGYACMDSAEEAE